MTWQQWPIRLTRITVGFFALAAVLTWLVSAKSEWAATAQETPVLVGRVELGKKLVALAVDSVAGEAVVIGDSNRLFLVRLEDRTVQIENIPGHASSVVVDPNRRLALIGTDSKKKSLLFYDLASRTLLSDALALQSGVRELAIDDRTGVLSRLITPVDGCTSWTSIRGADF